MGSPSLYESFAEVCMNINPVEYIETAEAAEKKL